MQRAAEISAQVFTARDAVLRGTPEDLRVGFLLFDSAIETLMVRKIRSLSPYLLRSESPEWLPSNWHQARAVLTDPTQIQSEKKKLGKGDHIDWVFSKTQIGKIEKDFSEKLRFLAWHGDIPPEYVKGVSRLHEYRNEMYHREVTRPDALRIVAHLYASITAEFLDLLKPDHIISYRPATDSTQARIYERMKMNLPAVAPHVSGGGFELQAIMAASLRRDLVLENVPLLIADYIENRVGNAHEMVEHVREFTASMRSEKLSEMDTIRTAYATSEASQPTRAILKRWNDWADKTRDLPDALAAFHSLADFEAEFEAFERIFEELAFQVDEEVDRQIDDAKERRRDEIDS
jgi:hypothetical protein